MAFLETDIPDFRLLASVSPLRKPLGATLLDDTTGPGEFEELCWHYLHSFPVEIKLGQIKTRLIPEHSEAETRAEGPGGGPRLEFDSYLFSGNIPVGQLMVSLYRQPGGDPDEIYLELEQSQIWKPELRNQGLGRAIIENVQMLGRKLQAQAITLFAMYDGRFAWPSLGFKFGDYLPEPGRAMRYRRAFRRYCRRYGVEPPATQGWDAPDFARFISSTKIESLTGHWLDQPRRYQQVELGRAFMLSRRPFFLCLPLE